MQHVMVAAGFSEIPNMVQTWLPVVFLVLPVTVLIAFWPGVIGLHLTTP